MQTLIIDMDEVMGDAHEQALLLYEERNGVTIDRASTINKHLFDCCLPEHKGQIENILNEKGFFSRLNPFTNAIEVMEALQKQYSIFVCSAAMQFPTSLEDKNAWLDKYFPFITWQQRILCGNKSAIKGDIMIDDHPYNLETFKGERTLLFSSHHNMAEGNYERVNSWLEVKAKLL